MRIGTYARRHQPWQARLLRTGRAAGTGPGRAGRPPFLAAVLAIALWPGLALAETLYLAPDGSAEGTGSLEAPFSSFAQAVPRLEPGTELVVRPGVYAGPLEISAAGTKEAPILIRSEVPAAAVIDGAGTEDGSILVDITADHLVFEGFKVRNARGVGISLWGTHNVTLRNNSVRGATGAGIWVGHEERGNSWDNIVEGNTVFDNARDNVDLLMERDWPSGIEFSASDGGVIRRNRVHGNYGDGISVLSSRGALIEGNLVYDNFSTNIYLDNAQDVRVEANVSGSSGDSGFYRKGRPPVPVAISDQEAPLPLPSRDNVIINNHFIGVGNLQVDRTAGNLAAYRSHVTRPNRVERGRINLDD